MTEYLGQSQRYKKITKTKTKTKTFSAWAQKNPEEHLPDFYSITDNLYTSYLSGTTVILFVHAFIDEFTFAINIRLEGGEGAVGQQLCLLLDGNYQYCRLLIFFLGHGSAII